MAKAIQNINIGASYNDPAAEAIRDSFDKCNDNFDITPIVYDTVAEMVADSSLADTQVVSTAGYLAAGDGGGNTYIYKATGRPTADGGFNLDGPGADDYFTQLDKSVANAKQFGATGDGVTNDHQALWDCSLAAIANSSICYIPTGTYATGSADYCFRVEDGETLRVHGDGVGQTIIKGDGTTTHYGCYTSGSLYMSDIEWTDFTTAIEPRPNVTNATVYTHLRNLKLYHNILGTNRGLINTPQSGPYTGATNICDWDNLDISVGATAVDAILVLMRGGCSNSVFRRLTYSGGMRHFANIPSSDPGLVDPSHAGDWNRDCVYDNCRHIDFGWTSTGSDSYSMMVAGINWTISNSYFGPCSTSNQSGGIYSNLHNSVIENNTFDTCGGVGHLFFKGSERLSPSTTVLNGWGWGNLIQGNTFKGQYGGVEVSQINMNVKEQTIRNNRFEDWATSEAAITANQQGSTWRNLIIDNNIFGPSANSMRVVRIDKDCESFDFTNNYIVDTNRTAGIAAIEFEQVGGSPTTWNGVRINGNRFFNTEYYFLGFRTDSCSFQGEIKNNIVQKGTNGATRGFSGGSLASLTLNVVWENNVIDTDDRNWNGVSSSFGAGSDFRNNSWTQVGATSAAPAYADGLDSGLTVAELPTASNYDGKTAYVTDGAAGSPCLAISDGTNWLRCDTLTAVSAT